MLYRASSRLAYRSATLQQTRSFAKSASSGSLSLKEYQEKYRTTASDILAALPKEGEAQSEADSEKLSELFAEYYDNIGAHTQQIIEKNKFRSSRAYAEIYNFYSGKMENFENPFYAMTHFPILSEQSGNKVHDEESQLNFMGDFFGVGEKERPAFDNLIRYGEMQDDTWVLDIQEEMNKQLDDLEDYHQDGIDALYKDLGSDNHRCDLRGFDPLFEENPMQELIELDKQYSMSAEEIESYNYLEELRKELSQEDVPALPELPDPFG